MLSSKLLSDGKRFSHFFAIDRFVRLKRLFCDGFHTRNVKRFANYFADGGMRINYLFHFFHAHTAYREADVCINAICGEKDEMD